MDPERWKRIDALLSEALQCEAAQRAAFLSRACEGDEELRKEVQTLLSEREAAGSFLQTPVAHAADILAAVRRGPPPSPVEENGPIRGSTLGRYIVLNKLGAGGMGVVYAAYDPELDRKVAVKLLRPEAADRRSDARARERLLREAQAMARLSHPNVIPVHDVGTLGEQVFIAMELIDGRTLTQWLTEKQRGAREVLEVFVQAGKGLAAAHAAGLVHRDFKPENVLIGRDGQVKVLDFGLARAVEDLATGAAILPQPLEAQGAPTPRALEAQLTKTGMFLGTPAYMAPEQLLGKATDARTDQFSFCVALYEALYGERPFHAGSVQALAEQVVKGEVKEPSKSSRVPGWVRQILLRGLRSNPGERYPSMQALLRELGKDPRIARRRILSIGAALLSVAGLGIAYRQAAHRQSQVCKGAERKLAGVWDEQRKSALSTAFLATGKLYAQDAVSGVQKTLDGYANSWVGMHNEACEATRIRGEQSAELLDLRMACLSERREELKSLVDVFLNPDAKMVANASQAASSLSGLETCADIPALTGPLKPPASAQSRAKVDELRQRIAQSKALQKAGKASAALPLDEAIVAETKALQYRPIEAEAVYNLGVDLKDTGDYKGAASTFMDAILAAEAGGHTSLAAYAWSSWVYLVGYRQSRFEEAKEQAKHVAALIERLGGDDKLLAELDNNLGVIFNNQGKYEEALDYHRRALKLKEGAYGPLDTTVATSLNSVGLVLMNQGKLQDAIDTFERAIEISKQASGPSHPQVARQLNNLGITLLKQNKKEEALAALRRGLVIQESALGSSHPETLGSRGNIAKILMAQGHYDEALPELRQVLNMQEKVYGPDHVVVAQTLSALADTLVFLKKYNEALDRNQRSLAIKEKKLGRDHPDLAYPLTGVGKTYLGLGQPRKALEVLERAVALRKNAKAHPEAFTDTRFALAKALSLLQREPDRARRLALEARQAIEVLGDSEKANIKEIDDWLAKHPRKKN